jgi:hypothetical protein
MEEVVATKLLQALQEHVNHVMSQFWEIITLQSDAYQSSQTGATESSGDIEGFYWTRLASFIIKIYSAQLGFGSVAFRRFS